MVYSEGILEAHRYLLEKYPKFFVIGQGVTSPWYVGNTMTDLDKEWGTQRIMDTPVSEEATTSIAAGAALSGYRPLIVHPRMDFMVLSANSMVNQIAKWRFMLGGQSKMPVTIRGIINRGGEQGAQHSQSLHSWFAHIPGLRVVMPALASDARDLLIASVLSDDPVLYIDDRWCYDHLEGVDPIQEQPLSSFGPRIVQMGEDITLAASGYSTHLALSAARELSQSGIRAEVIDLRVLNPYDGQVVAESVSKTGRLLAVDGGWRTSGFSAEVVSTAFEGVPPQKWRASPKRITLPNAPAPSSSALERQYYPTTESLVAAVREMV